MIDTTKLKASDGTGNAVLAHVTIQRLTGSTVLKVDSVSKWNTASFIATAGTVGADGFLTPGTVTEFTGHITAGDIIIDSYEPGFSDLGNSVGQVVVIKQTTGWANLVQQSVDELRAEDVTRATHYGADFILSGGVWSLVSGLNGAMTAVTGYQAGQRATLGAIASRLFTASKDTYVDLLRGGTVYAPTFTAVYTEVANGAASPALAANSIRLAKVVTSGVAITSVVQYGVDSLNNAIYPNGSIGFGNLDHNSTFLNIKSAANSGTISPSTGNNDFGSNCRISLTVAAPCIALVLVNVALGAAGDSEHRPLIYLDGVLSHAFTPSASTIASTSRQVARTTMWAVPIPTSGAHTISAGVFVSGSASYTVGAGGAEITVLVLGKVTA